MNWTGLHAGQWGCCCLHMFDRECQHTNQATLPLAEQGLSCALYLSILPNNRTFHCWRGVASAEVVFVFEHARFFWRAPFPVSGGNGPLESSTAMHAALIRCLTVCWGVSGLPLLLRLRWVHTAASLMQSCTCSTAQVRSVAALMSHPVCICV
jgi:hypothetical protein